MLPGTFSQSESNSKHIAFANCNACLSVQPENLLSGMAVRLNTAEHAAWNLFTEKVRVVHHSDRAKTHEVPACGTAVYAAWDVLTE